jgi:hypothetical protein
VFAACAAILVQLVATAALATSQPVDNPGFEADLAAPNSFPVLTPQGWSLYDPTGIVDFNLDAIGVLNPTGSTFFPAGAPEGSNVALVYLSGDVGGGHVGVSQILTVNLEAETSYTLSVAVGNIASGFGAPPFDSFFDLDGFPGYAVQLLAGDVVIAEDANGLAATLGEGSFDSSIVQIETGAEHPQLGAPLAIRLVNLNTPGTPDEPGIEVDFDDVQLDATPVPSPSRAALGLGAIATLVALGRRR